MKVGRKASKKVGATHNQNIQGVNMDDYTLTIKVDDGNLFEGSLEQWEDCFFAFPFHFSVNDKIEQIQNYCAGYSYDLVLSFKVNDQPNKPDAKIKIVLNKP